MILTKKYASAKVNFPALWSYIPCRRPILSRLLCFFSYLGLGPVCDEFRIWASNLFHFYFIESLSRFCVLLFIPCLFLVSFCYLCSSVILCRVISNCCLLIMFRTFNRLVFKYCFSYLNICSLNIVRV